mgnify:CR=1 FL=1
MAKKEKVEQKTEEQVQDTPAVVEETVEQAKEEVSKEADVETTEEKSEDFDASQFMSYDKETVEDLKEEDSKTENEPVSKDSKEESNDGSLSWDDVETETQEEEVKEEVEQDDPWSSLDNDLNTEESKEEETEETVEEKKPEAVEDVPAGLDWKKVSEELGVEANSKEELLGQLNKETQQAEYNNSAIDQLQDFLKLSDRDLLQTELKMQGQMEDYEIQENLDKLEDSGMLKYQANSLRGSVRTAIKQEQQKEKTSRVEEKQNKQKRITESRDNLKGFLKDNTMFFGGKVSETERMGIYKDICNGKLESLLYKDPGTTSKVMWMLRNPNKLEKVLYGRGLEAGKAQVLDNITTPDLGRRRKANYTIKDDSNFDAQQFMKK